MYAAEGGTVAQVRPGILPGYWAFSWLVWGALLCTPRRRCWYVGGEFGCASTSPFAYAWAPLFTSIAAAAPAYWPLALRERAQFPSVLSARGKRKARLVNGGDTGRSQCAQKDLGNARSYAAADPRRRRGPVARARRTHAGAAACTRMRPQIHMPHNRL